MVVLFSVIAAFSLATLLHVIEASFDDAWYAGRALAVIQTGYPSGSFDGGVLSYFEGSRTYFPLLGSWIDSWFVWLFGPTLFAVRFVSFLCGMALLGVTYLLATRMQGRRAGILAVIIGASSLPFIYSSHVGRQDVLVALLGYGALALYLYQDKPVFSIASFASGLAISLTLDIHPTGIVFPAVIVVLLLFDYGLGALRAGRTWAFIAGYLVGVSYYIAVHILPHPDTYFAISRIQQGSYVSTAPIVTLNPQVWVTSLWDTLSLAASSFAGLLVPLLLLAATLILLRKPARSDIRLLIIFAALVLPFAAIVPLKNVYYAILIAPAGWLVMAASAARILPLLSEWRRSLRAMLTTLVVVGVFSAVGVSNSFVLIQDRYPDFQSAMHLVRQTVPRGASIIGQDAYWLARPEDPYLVWEQFSYYRRYKPTSSLEDAFRALHPDYIVLDGLVSGFLTDDNLLLENNLAVEKAPMEAFLRAHASLVAQQTNTVYGLIRIYRIDWNSLD
jgi:4-amino-4-deoxy-L-arabinose transferase-like glycosyltransferase